MLLDLGAIAASPLFVIGIAVAVIVIKCLIIAGLARVFGNELAAQHPAWPAAQPGGRVRVRAVRAGGHRHS